MYSFVLFFMTLFVRIVIDGGTGTDDTSWPSPLHLDG